MPTRSAIVLLCVITLLAPASVRAQSAAISAYSGLPPVCAQAPQSGPTGNDLTNYCELASSIPRLAPDEQLTQRQLKASAEDELGLYNDALTDFPFDNRDAVPAKDPLPTPAGWHSVSAAEAIAALATQRRIVMINEAHHDAHTRVLTLELLPRLYAEGFRYLAIEALGSKDPGLMRRGYATIASGSEYLHEPLYGEIVRQAIRLGYTLVPYDSNAQTVAEREAEQASNIYRQVFARDPKARLLVHAGYAHIDKAPGGLGDGIEPMAMQLKQLSGLDPLSIDQTQFRDIDPGTPDTGAYGALLGSFNPTQPIVLRSLADGGYWSSNPARFDISVILPPSDTSRRPHWLALHGQRESRLVNTNMCTGHLPCVVEAHYGNEPDDATAADRYAFMHDGMQNVLYLYPGKYRLRAADVDGRTLGQRPLDVDKP